MWKPPSSRNNADCDCRVNPPCLFITLLPSCVCLFIFVKPCFRLPVALTYFWSSRAPLVYWSFFGIIRRWIKIITGQLFFFFFAGVCFHHELSWNIWLPVSGLQFNCNFFLMKTSVKTAFWASVFPKSLKGRVRQVFIEMMCVIRGERSSRSLVWLGSNFSELLSQWGSPTWSTCSCWKKTTTIISALK